MRFTRIGMFAVASLFATATARAGDEKKPALGDAEVQAMAKLHHGNTMEIEMGKLGGERAKAPEVKSFAQLMVRDHKKADDKLMALAKKSSVTISAPTPKNDAEKKEMEEQMATMTRLKTLEGEAFDREFMAVMVKDHAAALKLISETRPQTKNAGFLSYLKATEPVVKKHHAAAEKLVGKQPVTK